MSVPDLRASPPLSTPWVPLWPLGGQVGGAELAYAEWQATVSIPVSSEAAATTVVTAPAITVDGQTAIQPSGLLSRALDSARSAD